MKIMSIINLIWAPLTLGGILIVAISGAAVAESILIILGMALILGFVHTTAFSIVVLNDSKNTNLMKALVGLKELKENGILSEEEFQIKTIELLKVFQY